MLSFLSLYTVKQVHTKRLGNMGDRNIILTTEIRLEYNNITALLKNVYK
jgi:hypothetical protein